MGRNHRFSLVEQHYGPAAASDQNQQHVGIQLQKLVQQAVDVPNSQMRFVAWTDEELPEVAISPHVAQSRVANLIVAHLDYGPPPEPKRARQFAAAGANQSAQRMTESNWR